MEKNRSTTLQPALSSFYGLLIPGILLLPLFGAGLILIWLAIRKRSGTIYRVHDHEIVLSMPASSRTVRISDIDATSVRQNRLDALFGVGTIELVTPGGTEKMKGLRGPEKIAELIRHAASAEKKRLEHKKTIEARTPDQPPGTLERMNDLTGMWHQGLITDEEYHKERKHFE